jgi:hypothetical protein
LCRTPTTLTRDEFETTLDWSHQNRLEHPNGLDRCRQLDERFLIKVHTWLIGVWSNIGNRQLAQAGCIIG